MQAPQRSAVAAQHELIDERILRNHPDVAQIEVPLFSAANWGGAGLLDPARSLPYRPYLAHDEIQPIASDALVPVEVEIWPTCVVLERGHRLELEIGSQDDPRLVPFTHTDPADRILAGSVQLHTGGRYDSHLLLPRIPPR